jgi:E3 ubiquitin-protein ligase mind-bomb
MRSIVIKILFLCFNFSVAMEKRQSMSKVQVKGIFVGAKVVRGPDWDWGNQVI